VLKEHFVAYYSLITEFYMLVLFLQVKKDYLEGGAMADTADLVVLGAYYGTGSKGRPIGWVWLLYGYMILQVA